MNYTVDYFIEKFQATDPKDWCTGIEVNDKGQKCAAGWTGEKARSHSFTPESQALYSYFKKQGLEVAQINDREDDKYPQDNPRDRILAALEDIKKLTNKEKNDSVS